MLNSVLLSSQNDAKQNTWQEEFRAWLVEKGLAEHSIRSYELDAANYSCWFFSVNGEIFRPELMNSTDVRHYKEWMLRTKKLSPATWNRRRTTLGMLCQFFTDAYELTMPRIDRIERAEMVELAPRWLSEADKRKVLRSLETDILRAKTLMQRWRAVRDQAMVGLMMFAGLRLSEALALQLDDLELGDRKGKIIIRNGKGGVTGIVMISKSARVYLQDWLFLRGEVPGDVLFPEEHGRALKPRGVQKKMTALGIHAHALRHTCAKSMLEGGAKPSEVQKQMRHKRIEVTMRYVTPSEDDMAEAVERGELGKGGRW